jgi:hypothetical protein
MGKKKSACFVRNDGVAGVAVEEWGLLVEEWGETLGRVKP